MEDLSAQSGRCAEEPGQSRGWTNASFRPQQEYVKRKILCMGHQFLCIVSDRVPGAWNGRGVVRRWLSTTMGDMGRQLLSIVCTAPVFLLGPKDKQRVIESGN